jgi:hypothetical protein
MSATGKPEWIHDWARYRATDANGDTWEYEEGPIGGDKEWLPSAGLYQCTHLETGKGRADWRKTWEQRPETGG